MLDVDGATGEGSYELDVAVVEQVVFLAGEAGVGLLLDLEHDITSLDSGCLVTLTAEVDLGSASDTLVDVNVEDLAVDHGLLAIALLAAILVLNDLALAVAVRAHSLEALDHGTHLAHHGLHAVPVTACALLDGALLAADAGTLGADDGPLQRELGDLTAVDVLESDLVSVVNRAGLGRATAPHAASEHATHPAHAAEATTAEELGEEVLSRHATAAGTTLEAGLAILVVDGSLLGVG